MPTFLVQVKEISCGYIEVQASDAEKAEELAHEGYLDGEVFWGNSYPHYEVLNAAGKDANYEAST